MNRADYIADICRRLSQAEAVPFKEVSLEGRRPQMSRCHDNVNSWVTFNPGAIALRGWVTEISLGNMVRLTAHSVVQGADGEVFDITPLGDERVREHMRFIRHCGDDDAFFEAARDPYITCLGGTE